MNSCGRARADARISALAVVSIVAAVVSVLTLVARVL